MLDTIFVVATLAFFLLGLWYRNFCEELRQE